MKKFLFYGLVFVASLVSCSPKEIVNVIPDPPTVILKDPVAIKQREVSFGLVVVDNGSVISERGIVYSVSPNPTLANASIIFNSTTVVNGLASVTNLLHSTQYYVKAYAKHGFGIVYSDQKSFTTLAAINPLVNSFTCNNANTPGSVNFNFNVVSDGGADIVERGIVYKVTVGSTNPTIADFKKISGTGVGLSSGNISGLTSGTRYSFRAYTTTNAATVYHGYFDFVVQ